MIDLGKRQRDYAVYLPAISSFYTIQLNRTINDPVGRRVPAGFELGHDGLDFLKPKDSYYHYPYGLYSAGHSYLDTAKSTKEEPMVQQRDRSATTVLGDSGGFQVAKGVLKLDWTNAKDPNDPSRIDLCEKILRWLEHTADWAMTLDIPGFAAVPPFNKKTGLTSIQDTIDISMLNLDYFVRNRVPGKTKFLNVLSGTDQRTADEWYESVKHFSDPKFVAANYGDANRTLEGYAFAGINMRNMPIALKRILKLREDGLLEGKGWIHFLGTGKLNWACYLTSIQRMLRKHDSPNITLSFDAASPFVNTAYGQTYSYNFFAPKKFGYFMDRAFDTQSLKNSNLPMPFNGPIMERLTAGDICCMAEGDPDRNGKLKTADSNSWDSQSYLYYMAHSVYNHITAVQEANRLADIEKYRANVHYTDWINDKKNKGTNEFSPYVPYSVVYFDSFCQEVLDPKCPNPYELIDKYSKFLEEISFGSFNTETVLDNNFFEEEETVADNDNLSREEYMMDPAMDGVHEEQ
jgi:hypothetical protein